MLKQDQFFYFEILGENYHREDLVGLAWGIRRKFMSEGLSYLIVQSCVNFRKPNHKTYDFKRGKVLLGRKEITLPPATFDSRLAKYLLSTVEDNS